MLSYGRTKLNFIVCLASRHHCPHLAKRVVPWGPCVISEYNAKYRAHCLDRPKPIMPGTMISRSDEPLSDKTTHRLDFVPKPLEPPQRRGQEPYKPSSTPLDAVTNYRLDYTPKKACPPEPCLPLPICECPAKFDGSPTYKSKWCLILGYLQFVHDPKI